MLTLTVVPAKGFFGLPRAVFSWDMVQSYYQRLVLCRSCNVGSAGLNPSALIYVHPFTFEAESTYLKLSTENAKQVVEMLVSALNSIIRADYGWSFTALQRSRLEVRGVERTVGRRLEGIASLDLHLSTSLSLSLLAPGELSHRLWMPNGPRNLDTTRFARVLIPWQLSRKWVWELGRTRTQLN